MHIVNFDPNRTVDFDMGLFGTSAKIIFELPPRKKSTSTTSKASSRNISLSIDTDQNFKMGKDKSEKKDRKEKKEKRSDADGVKKSKKEKKSKLSGDNIAAAIAEVSNGESTEPTAKLSAEGLVVISVKPVGALVPFANPLADEKVTKKVLKSVKKGLRRPTTQSLHARGQCTNCACAIAAKNKTLKRGVKEVVKALRKSPQGAGNTTSPGVVILAADISPMDVISHIPVLCEDHNIPYIYVTSRAELGAAGNTKRPTSVVMVSEARVGAKKGEKIEDEEDFADVYKDLVKVVEKESRNVRV
jgi:H/ACA ribonucleoprotein complex subunit 2